jgi:PhoH-like ATPase|tara:strand:- start:11041 stop:12354 length:1314 start_codon:yes stop_codon:yes gene_type:complete
MNNDSFETCLVKQFVLDTSVLIYHEDSIHGFPDSTVILPVEVLEELDSLKTRNDAVGNSARYVNRFLDKLRESGSLSDGVRLENGQIIKVFLRSNVSSLPGSFKETMDNKILSCAYILSKEGTNTCLISRDIALRVKADSIGIKAENYIKEKATIKRKGAYTGVSVINITPSKIDSFYEDGSISSKAYDLMPNECVVLKNGKQSALAINKEDRLTKLIYANKDGFNVQGISPRNKEQAFSMELLLNPNINMLTLTGKAGSGKTLLSIATAIDQLMRDKYEKIVISRPVQSTSKDIGFLPGNKFEKMEPWLQPIFDNLKLMFSQKGDDYLQILINRGKIEVEALAYIRGRSLPNTIFILDEAQNITHHEAKAVLTRIGENSKVILLGDLEQIDAPHLDSVTSGLASVVERFKDFELSAHITLLKGERSPLATHAAKIM